MQIIINISIEANNFDKKPILNHIYEFVTNVLNNHYFHAVYIICMQPVPDNSQTFTSLEPIQSCTQKVCSIYMHRWGTSPIAVHKATNCSRT